MIRQDTDPTQKVLFGAGIRHDLLRELTALGLKRALLLSTPDQSASALDLASHIGASAAGVYSKALMHTPVEVSEDAMAYALEVNADCLVAVGGGSTTGLAKAVSLRTGLPQVVIPTTYAGSEATPILGQTEDGIKTTITDPAVLPDVVLYDPELVVSLPAQLTLTSGLNAMAHAAEALYARDRTEETTELAISGLESFARSLPEVLRDPENVAAREETLRGAWACGHVLGRVGMALHHKLCHTLGGSFDLPHAQTHAVVLPHAIHYNTPAAEAELAPISEIIGGGQPGPALWDFATELGAPKALSEFGLKESDLDLAAELATKNPYWNPRPIMRDGIRSLLLDAWSGDPPGTNDQTWRPSNG